MAAAWVRPVAATNGPWSIEHPADDARVIDELLMVHGGARLRDLGDHDVAALIIIFVHGSARLSGRGGRDQ